LFLGERFQKVTRNDDIAWLRRSPDLTRPDLFLWGFLKSKMFTDKSPTLQELIVKYTKREMTAIDVNMLQKVMESMHRRLSDYIENKSGHLGNVIFKN